MFSVIRRGREKDAVTFAELHRKLQSQVREIFSCHSVQIWDSVQIKDRYGMNFEVKVLLILHKIIIRQFWTALVLQHMLLLRFSCTNH